MRKGIRRLRGWMEAFQPGNAVVCILRFVKERREYGT
jgi:hypothetical protein